VEAQHSAILASVVYVCHVNGILSWFCFPLFKFGDVMKKLNSVICAAFLAMVSTVAMSDGTTLPSAEVIEAMTASATVTAVDKAKRTFTVTGQKGKSHTFTAGADMQNFDQIKVGDKIEASYVEEASISVNKTGLKPIIEDKTTVARAEKGGRPGMIVTNTVEAVGVITAVDQKTRSVTVKGPRGNELTTTVKAGIQGFENVKKGDNVVLNHKQVLTIADVAPDTFVAPAQKK
jgi:branched-subunit amino acid transport protein AzlD